MKELSKNAELSKMYTNHCIHASVVSTLDENGFESCHIMHVTSHKSEESLKSYGTWCPEKKRKAMFQSLSNTMPRMTEETGENSMLNIQYSPVKEGWFDHGMRGDTAATIPGLSTGHYPINWVLKGFKPCFFTPTKSATISKPPNLSTISKSDMEDTGIDFLSELENDDFDQKKLVALVEQIEKENAQAEAADENQPIPGDLAPVQVPSQLPTNWEPCRNHTQQMLVNYRRSMWTISSRAICSISHLHKTLFSLIQWWPSTTTPTLSEICVDKNIQWFAGHWGLLKDKFCKHHCDF